MLGKRKFSDKQKKYICAFLEESYFFVNEKLRLQDWIDSTLFNIMGNDALELINYYLDNLDKPYNLSFKEFEDWIEKICRESVKTLINNGPYHGSGFPEN